jgi:perosamine synthetase
MILRNIEDTIRSVIKVGKAGLHEPFFDDKEIIQVTACINSSFVSSVSDSISKFEDMLCEFTGAEYAIALVNGTSALHLALESLGVSPGDEVLVPALTFAASANAICHAGATPHFIESNYKDLGVNVDKLEDYLNKVARVDEKNCWNIHTGKKISAIMPVHIFGHIGEIERLCLLARTFKIKVVEDAAEALGSFREGKHAGTFGECGVISFNGNKIITTGGGGAVLTNDQTIAEYINHLAKTAKIDHPYQYWHDKVGYNCRMPGINASMGVSQLSKLQSFLDAKCRLASAYQAAFINNEFCDFFNGPKESFSNNWLNTILLKGEDITVLNRVLEELNSSGLGCRPLWSLLSDLPHFRNNPQMPLSIAKSITNKVINIPSSAFLAPSHIGPLK